MEIADVAVIGGGPAGTTAATLIKRYEPSRRVVLFEPVRFPRHHIGESTLPDMNPILNKLGVLDRVRDAGFVPKVGITYKWAKDRPIFSEVFSRGVLDALERSQAPGLPDHAWQVDRSRYDQLLLERALEVGVEVVPARVESLLRDGPRVCGVRYTFEGVSHELATEFVVDGSGQARVLARWLSLGRNEHQLGDLAIYRYYRGMKWNPEIVGEPHASKIFFAATATGWIWFIPLSATEVSVGLVTRRGALTSIDPDALFERELASVPEMIEMLADASMMSAPGEPTVAPRTHTVADWSYSHAEPAGPGYYLAGDAAAFVDPILSSGILLAHHSGLSVANAIRTQWRHPEIEVRELHAAYADFYRDMYGGFLTMARWWYERRDVGIDEWHSLAADLGRGARGARELDRHDVASFMTFAAGYLTDARFVTLGCGFGSQGLAVTLDGLDGPKAGDRLRREILDRSVRFRRRFVSVEPEAYLSTDVDSDRWWQMPALRFRTDDGERTYRPPIFPEHREEWIGKTLRITEQLLRRCDGTRTVDEIVRATRDAVGADHPEVVQRLSNVILADLARLDVISA